MKTNTITAAATLRLTEERDIPLLPAIERSAAQAFRQIPALAWLAESEVISPERHRLFLETDHSLLAVAEIAVHQAWQGRGIGRMMLEQVIETARQAAYPAVTLTTFRDVPWNAPFYTRLGFSMLSERRLLAGLAAKRELETEHGLPPETRCAMRLTL